MYLSSLLLLSEKLLFKSIKGDHENYLCSELLVFHQRSLCAGMLTEAAKVFEKLGDRRRCEEVNTLLKTMNCC